MTTMPKKLRDAAQRCSRPEYAAELRRCADLLQHRLKGLSGCATDAHLRDVNGAWALAQRLLDNVPDEADPMPPLAGSPEPARLAA